MLAISDVQAIPLDKSQTDIEKRKIHWEMMNSEVAGTHCKSVLRGGV